MKGAKDWREVDLAEEYLNAFLQQLGLDTNLEHLADTPKRITRFYRQWLAEGEETFRFTTFKATSHDMVMTGDLRYYSLCGHHFVPFFGYAHIAYLPNERMAGLSKLARTVNMFSHRPQVQEQLTRQVAEYLQDKLQARGVGVVMSGEHLCMSMRGIRLPGHQTVTETYLGEFNSYRVQARFRDYINLIHKENRNNG